MTGRGGLCKKTGSEHESLASFFVLDLKKRGRCTFFHPNKYNPIYNLQTMKPPGKLIN